MSTNLNPPRPDLPSAAVDRVFARMLAIYGAQRMTAAWGDVPADERRVVWGRALARAVWSPVRQAFDLEAIGEALDELAVEPSTWPPSSGEFAEMCSRKAQRPGRNVLALPVPKRSDAEIRAGAEQMQRIRALLAKSVKRVPE
jgi:hypothetical protein